MSHKIEKPKTQRGKRVVEAREPKIHENTKSCMLIKGGNTSQLVSQALKELHMLKRPHAVLYKKKNATRPFEDETSVEFFSTRADASLFGFGSHSKKRPNNLILGRLYNGHLLDMVEFGVDHFKSMSDYQGPKFAAGMKPALYFQGEAFKENVEYQRIQNLLTDFFQGPSVKKLRRGGIEHCIVLKAEGGKIYLRTLRVVQRKVAGSTAPPTVEASSVGPSFNLSVRRSRLASDDLFKQALKQPRTAKVKKRKNVSMDVFGSKLGRIHMTSQDLSKLPDRRMKRLKRLAQPQAQPEGESETSQASKKPRPAGEED